MRNLLWVFVCAACGSSDEVTAGAGDASTPLVDVGVDSSPPPPKCGASDWLTYGHDARRTSASDACIDGQLAPAWTYVPMGGLTSMHHVIASTDAVYVQWAAPTGPYVGTTAADRVSPQGKRVWTYDTGSDANLGNWASVSGGNLVLQDDGLYFVDLVTGKVGPNTGVDWWGQTIPAANGGVWFANTSKSDGPGLFVGLMDMTAKTTWKGNEQGTMCGDGFSDVMGGIAVDGSVLFYAPVYKTGSAKQPLPSGVYAFDALTGSPKWNVMTTPASAISVGDGFVYLIEGGELVARKQADGTKAWSVPAANAGAQSPVLANHLVIIATQANVVAVDATTGTAAWTSPVVGAAAQPYQRQISNGCSGLQTLGAATITTLAAALPSGTLVVTASDGIHVLALKDGSAKWSGKIPGAKFAVHDPVLVGKMVYVIDSAASFAPGSVIALTAM